jgi:hypothetical protein
VLFAQKAPGEAFGAHVVATIAARQNALRAAALATHSVAALCAGHATLVARTCIAVGAAVFFVFRVFKDENVALGALAAQRLDAVRQRGDGGGAHASRARVVDRRRAINKTAIAPWQTAIKNAVSGGARARVRSHVAS